MRIITGAVEQENGYQINFLKEPETTLAEALAGELHLFTTFERGNSEFHPTLIINTISEPAILLGRYQNEASTLKEEAWKYPVLRRLSGGQAVFMDKGSVFITFILPEYSKYLKAQTIRSVPKILNDIMLSAFRTEGLSLSLAAADVLTKRGYEVGGVGFEITEKTAVCECWLGMNSSLKLPEGTNAYPALSDEAFTRKPIAITEILDDSTFPQWDQTMAEIISLKMRWERYKVVESTWKWLDRERIAGLKSRVTIDKPTSENSELTFSRLIEDYIGFVQAAVSTTEGRMFQEVKIFGDFLADSAGIALLEEKLRWSPVKKRPIALIIDDILGNQGHVILGLKRLGTILEAIMDASGKEETETEGD
ncbi:MAG: lipoate--protein ligase family protein [Deltaproteobacteria bacterium]|nr:lipoate--protein ligase family protein [Deltaproteobacteria bacterium]